MRHEARPRVVHWSSPSATARNSSADARTSPRKSKEAARFFDALGNHHGSLVDLSPSPRPPPMGRQCAEKAELPC